MGRKTQLTIEKERRGREAARRDGVILALCDGLAEKVGVALAATDPLDTKELKQLSGIIKELSAVMGTCLSDELAERELRHARLLRELSEEEDPRQLRVSFAVGTEELTV